MIRKILLFLFRVFFVVLFLSSCSPGSRPAIPTLGYATTAPRATQVKSVPTPLAPGQVIIHKDLRVGMGQAETTAAYQTQFGSSREPAAGLKFIWIEVQLENLGSKTQNLPTPEHFSVVYGAIEFKPTYGYREGYLDYTSLKAVIYQGQSEKAWLRFDIPAAAELRDLRFVFLPESVQVNYSSPSSGQDWAEHPEYFWQCGQE